MEFRVIESIYQTATDYAKEKNYLQIVELLSKGPILPNQNSNESQIQFKGKTKDVENSAAIIQKLEEKISQLKLLINELKQENEKQKISNKELEDKNSKLEQFIHITKEKSTTIELMKFDDYEELNTIGEGATSTVKRVMKREREIFAKKELKLLDKKSLQRFIQESELLFKLRHPCIVRIYGFDYGSSQHPPSIYLSLEPTSLEQSIENNELSEEEKNRISVEIVLGLRYIHSCQLMHRDLKPSNILLSKNRHVRISDFGLAKEESLETTQSKGIGTRRFMAPEPFEDEDEEDEDESVKDKDKKKKGKADIGYNNKVDVYSFGIILIFIITGKYPRSSMKNVVNGVLPKLPSTIVSWVGSLIRSCLSLSPESRPTFNDIFETLRSHNFDLFSESQQTKLTAQQRKYKEEIEHRILKIEAFEYQHRT